MMITVHWAMDDHKIFQSIIDNVVAMDAGPLFKEFNGYFKQLNGSILDNKVIAVYSYNKNFFAKMFIVRPSSSLNFRHILQVKFRDNIKLFYLSGVKFPYQKFIKIILYSQKKFKFLKMFHGSLASSLEALFQGGKNQFFIHRSPFNLLFLDGKINEQVVKINEDMLGNGQINVEITTMEAIIIKQSLANKFLLMVDNGLIQLEYFLQIFEKAQEGFHSEQFFSLKKDIFFNFVHKISNEKLNNVDKSQWTNNYIFDENRQDISRKEKLKIINYFASRDILWKIYEYIY